MVKAETKVFYSNGRIYALIQSLVLKVIKGDGEGSKVIHKLPFTHR